MRRTTPIHDAAWRTTLSPADARRVRPIGLLTRWLQDHADENFAVAIVIQEAIDLLQKRRSDGTAEVGVVFQSDSAVAIARQILSAAAKA